MKFFDIINGFRRPEKHPLQVARLETICKMKKHFKFLEKHFSYKYSLEEEFDQCPGGPEFYINKYTNLKAQRQIEITLHRNSSAIYFFLKKLNSDIEPAYNDKENCFSFYEIDFYNGIDDFNRHHSYHPPHYELGQVKVGVEILNQISPILRGIDWFDRKYLDDLYFQKKGSVPGDSGSWVYSIIKENFKYLLTDYDFKIIHDNDLLRPFEKGLGGAIVYANEKRDIAIGFSVDLRDWNASLYNLKLSEYDRYSFWQTGNNIWEGGITKNDIIASRIALVNAQVLF